MRLNWLCRSGIHKLQVDDEKNAARKPYKEIRGRFLPLLPLTFVVCKRCGRKGTLPVGGRGFISWEDSGQ